MDDIITRLLEGKDGRQVQLTEGEIYEMCATANEIFISEPNLLELGTPMKICGDIHGQFSDLIQVFEIGGYPPASDYLFLGNYIGCSIQNFKTFFLLLAYKIKYPNKIFLLRGKHEFDLSDYRFYHQFKRRFNIELPDIITNCFECLPFAAVIQDKIFCVNGGLSPLLKDLDQIRNIKRHKPSTNGWDYWDLIIKDSLESDTLHSLLWPDSEAIFGWIDNERDALAYRRDIVIPEFLDKHGLYLICRSNQFVEDGYEFFGQKRLLTIITASNFQGEYGNSGAILSVDESLICSLKMFKTFGAKQKNREGSSKISWRPGSPPCRSEPEAPPPLDDGPNSSRSFNVLDARMSFCSTLLCSFQVLIACDKKRNARTDNSSQEPDPPHPPPVRKAQKH